MNRSSHSDEPSRDSGDSFLRTLFSWPNVIVVVIIAVIALIAGFNAEENWRGERAWNKYRKTLKTRGESLDLNSFIPLSISSEENFAATPLIRSWFPRGGLYRPDAYDDAFKWIPKRGTNLNENERHFLDLVAWEMAFQAVASGEQVSAVRKFQTDQLDFPSRSRAAPAVLNALTNSQEMFNELREASRRPRSRYPVTYDLEKPWGILLPHLGSIKQLCQRLELKACAELAAGNGENALADVQLLLYLGNSLKGEPFLISHLVRLSCLQIGLQPIWEGLAEQTWNDAQLQELQKQISQYNFVADTKQSLRGERAFAISTIHSIGENRKLLAEAFGGGGSASFESHALEAFTGMIPRGWFFHEQVNYCKLFQTEFGDFLTATNRLISPGQAKERAAKIEKITGNDGVFTAHRRIAALLLPALGKTLFTSAKSQVAFDHAQIACALERYRLANGRFPGQLDLLIPRFASQLPVDVLAGTPYHYRLDGASFVLYSSGWDEMDNGGEAGKTMFDKTGDWVWKYPAD